MTVMKKEAFIELTGMRFRAFHGCLESERTGGNDFVVDFRCRTDIGKAGLSDNLEDTLDYSSIYGMVSSVMTGESRMLLESLATGIEEAICGRYPSLEYFEIKISKLNPPVGGPAERASVSICHGK